MATDRAAKATAERKARFLAAFREDGTVTHAAKIAAIDRATVYRWLEDDDAFAKDYADAKEEGIESLERVARERAKNKSDVLLIFLLKAARPDIYADRVKTETTNVVRIVDDL